MGFRIEEMRRQRKMRVSVRAIVMVGIEELLRTIILFTACVGSKYNKLCCNRVECQALS